MSEFYAHVTPEEFLVEPQEWGRLEWAVSGPLGRSSTMTTGTCYILPGAANGRHRHECDEILIVRRGHIVHTVDDASFEMREGDVVSIPAGRFHNATNISDEVAELSICFSDAFRTTEPEEPGGAE